MRSFTSFLLAALILTLGGTARAVPVEVSHIDDPECDPLFVPQFVDELGFGTLAGGPFPADEEIFASSTQTAESACISAGDDPGIPNALVVMTNHTPFDFTEVWYVADEPDSHITNFDGYASAGMAFRIDTLGVNRPLVGEDLGLNGIFESGETWEFIIQDYSHVAGLAPELFLSAGLVGLFSGAFAPHPGGIFDSSGSIIAVRAPEPSALALAGIGLAALAFVRRRATW